MLRTALPVTTRFTTEQEAALTPGKDLLLGGGAGRPTEEIFTGFNLMGPDSNLFRQNCRNCWPSLTISSLLPQVGLQTASSKPMPARSVSCEPLPVALKTGSRG